MDKITIDEIAMFCKRKGFVFPSGDIYGGLAGFWDFGPLGCELKKNIKDAWWSYHVNCREDMTGIDGSIITHPKVWQASGHIASFVDLAVICKKCKNKTKIDKHEINQVKCEKCGGEFENKGEFNPMFKTQVGPVEEDSMISYLRPETAQLIFSNFRQVNETTRLKLPFGIAQIGKAFRNEIAPRNFLFRCREFEQMEIEYFIDPEEKMKCPFKVVDIEVKVYSSKMQKNNEKPKLMKIEDALKEKIIKLPWHAYWLSTELNWFKILGANMDKFRIRQHMDDEKSHYATDTWDIEYEFSFGFKELQGIADRGIYDLSQHQEFSKKSMEIMDEEKNKKILPMVISEPSLGVERTFLVFLFDSFFKNEKGEIILKINPRLSPIKASILPLVKKDKELVKKAKEVYDSLKVEFNVSYDDSGSVGRRYARNDEIGTPYCFTIDSQSLKDNTATIRNRDDSKQKRVEILKIRDVLRELILGELKFSEL
jgi:glycyl-tRNA synthetase